MKTLLVVNRTSGNGGKIDADAVRNSYAKHDDVTVVEIKKAEDGWSADGYDKIIVCGGDGTLMRAVNKIGDENRLLYIPCGTFNESAKTNKIKRGRIRRLTLIGFANDTRFTYVCAAGSFTPIGYDVKEKDKKLFKIMAYLVKVFKHYKIYRIPAAISANGKSENGEYTLIMMIHSKRCFGFRFNRMYDENDPSLYMLTIKSPKHDGLLGAIEMFFPFFRSFFIGFGKEYHSKNIDFMPVCDPTVTLEDRTDFCVDGDKLQLNGAVAFGQKKLKGKIYICR